MDNIIGHWANLSLNMKETQTVEVKPAKNDTDNNEVLVAKFFTKQRLNMEAITRTLRSMWRSSDAIEIRDLGANTVLLLFDDKADVQRILMQGPWTFDKYLIGLFKPGDDTAVEDAMFDRASFYCVIAHKTLFSPSFCRKNIEKRCPIFKAKIWQSFEFGVLWHTGRVSCLYIQSTLACSY